MYGSSQTQGGGPLWVPSLVNILGILLPQKTHRSHPGGGGIYWRPPSKLSPRQIVSIPIGGDSPGVNMTAAYF